MHKLSSVLAFITNKIFIVLLIITALGLAQAVAVANVLTDKNNVKSIIKDSGFYVNLPNNAIYLVKIEDDSTQPNASPTQETVYQALQENGFISESDISNVIIGAISPEFLQSQTERLIDNTYSYLDGSTEEILFSFSLKEQSGVVKEELNKVINDKLSALPTCSYEKLLSQVGQNINILEASCLPPGVSLQAEVDKFTNDITTQEDGLFSQEFTQDDMQISGADISMARYVYNSLTAIIWMFWLLIISFGAVIVLTSKTLHRGLKTVGEIYITVGAFLLIIYQIYIKNLNLVDKIVTSGDGSSEKEAKALTDIFGPIVNGFISQIVHQVTIISTIIILLGIALVVLGIIATKHHIEHLYLPKNKDAEQSEQEANITSSEKDNNNSDIQPKAPESSDSNAL